MKNFNDMHYGAKREHLQEKRSKIYSLNILGFTFLMLKDAKVQANFLQKQHLYSKATFGISIVKKLIGQSIVFEEGEVWKK